MSEKRDGDQRETPRWLVDELEDRYAGGCFDLDVAASDTNHKADAWLTEEENALVLPWDGNCFCNPPWSDIHPWIVKSHEEVTAGRANVVVLVLPARTGTLWFAYAQQHAELILFLRGRPQFDRPDGIRNSSNPEDVCAVIFRKPMIVAELRERPERGK